MKKKEEFNHYADLNNADGNIVVTLPQRVVLELVSVIEDYSRTWRY